MNSNRELTLFKLKNGNKGWKIKKPLKKRGFLFNISRNDYFVNSESLNDLPCMELVTLNHVAPQLLPSKCLISVPSL